MSKNLPFHIATGAIFAALLLGAFSWMSLCSHACVRTHDYLLYGYAFESIGLPFFAALLTAHLFARKSPAAHLIAACLLCAALGAEIVFIYTQKYKIGSWCPICLTIAGTLITAASAYLYIFYQNYKDLLKMEVAMHSLWKGSSAAIFFTFGFFFAFFGISSQTELQAAEANVKDNIAFGQPSSPLEVYIFTDWRCTACRNLEPVFESAARKLMGVARITFVDYAVHPDSLNFTPYNLSFMVNNKPNYFALRKALGDLGASTRKPTDQQIQALASRQGTQYTQLGYADVALGIQYFNHLVKQLHVQGTPSVVVFNKTTKKMKKLEGEEDISEAKIMESVNKTR